MKNMPVAKPEFVVFYAWQSDRPGNRNRYLIQEAAAKAAEELNAESTLPYSVRIDQDTQGEPGLCDIPATILAKIEAADAFLCDLTYVAKSESDDDAEENFRPKSCSNPNVLFELGYAFRTLGPERVLCVMNEYYGPAAEQIFDLAHRRFPMTYRLPDTSRSRKDVLTALAGKLKDAIVNLMPLGNRTSGNDLDRVSAIRDEFESRVRGGTFHRLTRRHGAIAISVVPGHATKLTHDQLPHQSCPPPGRGGWNNEIRGKSIITFRNQDSDRVSVAELRTDGVILGADTWTLDPTYHPNKNLLVPSTATESTVISAADNYLKLLSVLKAPLPWTICVSLLEVKDYFLYASDGQDRWTKFPERDISCEPIIINTLGRELDRPQVATIVRPAIDFIWREFGFEGSFHYTSQGIYNVRY